MAANSAATAFSFRNSRTTPSLPSPTDTESLESYAIGPKLRALRLRRSMGLVHLGKQTSLSPGLLSKLETGKLYPTLPTLLRIARVFGVGLDHFFTTSNGNSANLTRHAERLRFPEKMGISGVAYLCECLSHPLPDSKLSVFLAQFESESSKAPCHQHAGCEVIYLLEGKLSLRIGLEEFALEEGDSIQFDSGTPHSYHRLGIQPCSAILVHSR
ncbi:MAG TPA: XRE family transcriptional regulator [Terriglobales bacterium]|nr:XRE family transcriptional regulator [Terriglobales bacterium]